MELKKGDEQLKRLSETQKNEKNSFLNNWEKN